MFCLGDRYLGFLNVQNWSRGSHNSSTPNKCEHLTFDYIEYIALSLKKNLILKSNLK